MNRQLEPHRLRVGAAMWSAIGLSGIVLAALLARGWGRSAWNLALGLLLLSCLGVCGWAVVTGERSSRLVKRETERLADARREQSPR